MKIVTAIISIINTETDQRLRESYKFDSSRDAEELKAEFLQWVKDHQFIAKEQRLR